MGQGWLNIKSVGTQINQFRCAFGEAPGLETSRFFTSEFCNSWRYRVASKVQIPNDQVPNVHHFATWSYWSQHQHPPMSIQTIPDTKCVVHWSHWSFKGNTTRVVIKASTKNMPRKGSLNEYRYYWVTAARPKIPRSKKWDKAAMLPFDWNWFRIEMFSHFYGTNKISSPLTTCFFRSEAVYLGLL